MKKHNGMKAVVTIPGTAAQTQIYRWSKLNTQMKTLVILAHVELLRQPSELLTLIFNEVKPKVMITVKDDVLHSATVHKDDAPKMSSLFKKLTK